MQTHVVKKKFLMVTCNAAGRWGELILVVKRLPAINSV
jgi:hypothetical protein